MVESHFNIQKDGAMRDSTISETGSQFIFLKWTTLIWEQGDKAKKSIRNLCEIKVFFAVLELMPLNVLQYGIVKKQPPEVSCKKVVFKKISQILQENTCVGVFFY